MTIGACEVSVRRRNRWASTDHLSRWAWDCYLHGEHAEDLTTVEGAELSLALHLVARSGERVPGWRAARDEADRACMQDQVAVAAVAVFAGAVVGGLLGWRYLR